jgi:hypothetical protein
VAHKYRIGDALGLQDADDILNVSVQIRGVRQQVSPVTDAGVTGYASWPLC